MTSNAHRENEFQTRNRCAQRETETPIIEPNYARGRCCCCRCSSQGATPLSGRGDSFSQKKIKQTGCRREGGASIEERDVRWRGGVSNRHCSGTRSKCNGETT
eukprot:9468534-Pyramimonas_sp.AAC.1